jgi:menaquinone reductase, multiheme cytochrome c subunit
MQIPELVHNVRQRGLVLGAAGFLFAFLVAVLWPARAAVTQPIRFNHSKHIAVGLQCSNCHVHFENSAFAGLPEIDVCMTCHAQPMTQSPEEEKIREFAKQNLPIPWRQVNELPKHVYFSHLTHAVSKGINCAVCHGAMDKATVPPQAPLMTWKMDTCLACHKKLNANQDCDGCHR